jgi:hypothetical protein
MILSEGIKLDNSIDSFFNDFEYLISVENIRKESINGFIKKLTYKGDKYAILKSAKRQEADNLLFEYLVGQYINKQCYVFSCFIKTYGWFQYRNIEDWKKMKTSETITVDEIKNALIIGTVAVENYKSDDNNKLRNKCYINKQTKFLVAKDCTEIEYLLKIACAKSTYLSILTEYIMNAKSLLSKLIDFTRINESFTINELQDQKNVFTDFTNQNLLNVLYQIYMPLATLSETFTHYDLHIDNILIYELVPGKYIDYKYVLKDESIVEFKCKYIAKIIDYGRCFFKDDSNKEISGSSKSIYESICRNIPEGGLNRAPYCGENQGFSNFDTKNAEMSENFINSSVRNITNDLLLLYTLHDMLNYIMLNKSFDIPEKLKVIFDKLEYKTEKKLINLQEKYYNIPDQINNVIDAHNALKTQIRKYKSENDLHYQETTAFASLTIYESGQPIEYVQHY